MRELTPLAAHGVWPCRGEQCDGYKFGAFAHCEHGARLYLNELNEERDRVTALLGERGA